ncbi:MAG: DUF5132 domain-containing protein [Acetobacteraceae bacterium]|nr:DUF5132 domain-containing protein [Acetobacteraceae bacterium]
MALLDDVLEGGLGTGIVAAVGVAVLGPVLVPVLRSTAKMAIRGGMMAYDYGRQAVAELGEMAGDLAAETRAEAAAASHSASSRTAKSS